MKSSVFTWIVGGIFTLLVFTGGFISAFYLNYASLGNTYTKEHVDNGRFMLWALKHLEDDDVDKAKNFLRGQVSTKVLIVDSVRLPPTSKRELELIESFYLEVIEYFDAHGGLNETFQVMENDKWVNRPTAAMKILEEFKADQDKWLWHESCF
ncbi:hypothetical protein [Thalassotalea montiporae]